MEPLTPERTLPALVQFFDDCHRPEMAAGLAAAVAGASLTDDEHTTLAHICQLHPLTWPPSLWLAIEARTIGRGFEKHYELRFQSIIEWIRARGVATPAGFWEANARETRTRDGCKRQVSSSTPICPDCGASLPPAQIIRGCIICGNKLKPAIVWIQPDRQAPAESDLELRRRFA